MSALNRAARTEQRAYDAMVDAQADVIALQLTIAGPLRDGVQPSADVTERLARLRRRSASLRKQWLAAARHYEDVNAREWAYL